MSVRLYELRQCDCCDRDDAIEFAIAFEGERYTVDLCSDHDKPVREAAECGRKTGPGVKKSGLAPTTRAALDRKIIKE